MNNYVTAGTIKELRAKKGITQKQLAELLSVCEKTVSKWETGRGLPDITMLEPLAANLNVSVAELLSGETVKNSNKSANLMRSRFYVCPVCSNVIWSTGEGAFSCCGVSLPPLEAEPIDDEHIVNVEKIENEKYITVNHPMTKTHYISFIALVCSDRTELIKLYPEQDAAVRLFCPRGGMLYIYCNRHGLYKAKI